MFNPLWRAVKNWKPAAPLEVPKPETAPSVEPEYVVGLDLGQVNDPSALAVLERTETTTAGGKPIRNYAIRHLMRWPLLTSYPDIVEAVAALLAKPPLPGCTLLVDSTGVGRAVVDLFRRAKLPARLVAITITAGTATTTADHGFHVPKRELVSVTQALLQTHRLQIAQGLRDAKVLTRELAAFRVKVTTSGSETFEAWRERDHDDLVFAVALAVWHGERRKQVRVRFSDDIEGKKPSAPRDGWK